MAFFCHSDTTRGRIMRVWQGLTISILGHLMILCLLTVAGTKTPGRNPRCIEVRLVPGDLFSCSTLPAGNQGLERGPGAGAEIEFPNAPLDQNQSVGRNESPAPKSESRKEETRRTPRKKTKQKAPSVSPEPRPKDAESPRIFQPLDRSNEPEPSPSPGKEIRNTEERPPTGDSSAGESTSSMAGVGNPGAGKGGGGRGGAGSSPFQPGEAAFGSADGPHFIRRAKPQYPSVARQLGKEGLVLLRVSLDEQGKVTGIEIVNKAGSGFDEEAIKAVEQSTFSPAKKDGQPVECKVLLPVRFQLKGPG